MELKKLLGLLDAYGLEYKLDGDPEKVNEFINTLTRQFISDGLLPSRYSKIEINDLLPTNSEFEMTYDKVASRKVASRFDSNKPTSLCA